MTGPLVGVSGRKRAGKDTFASALVERGFVRYSFADKVREALLALDPVIPTIGTALWHKRLSWLVGSLGWETLKDDHPEVRRLLQRLGTEVGRSMFGENIWVDLTMRELPPDTPVVIPDVRFPNEADAIVSRGGIVVRVVRGGLQSDDFHPSETAIDDYPFDVVVSNDRDVEHLRQQAFSVMGLEP